MVYNASLNRAAHYLVAAAQNQRNMTRFFILLLFAALFVACGGAEGTAVEASDAVEANAGTTTEMASTVYNLDASASSVSWEGSKLVGDSHTGGIPVTDGTIVIADNKIVAGRFAMDVRGLTNTDMPADKGGDKLVGHLKSADFFEVEKYPMAQFEVTNVQPVTDVEGVTHNVTGNLVLKGTAKSITIPANVSIDGDMVKASTPQFTINRMDWGIEYGNGSIAGLAQDRIISDEVGLQLNIVAKKQ